MTSLHSSWQPLLDGQEASSAQSAARAVAASIQRFERSPALADLQFPGLARGAGGIALLFSYLNTTWPSAAYADTAERFYERAIEGASRGRLPHGLYAGYTGIAWLSEHLENRLFESDEDDSVEGVDEQLDEIVRQWSRNDVYDLISGLAGIGIYMSERLPRARAQKALASIVDRLDDMAETTDHGVTWFTPAASIPASQRARTPTGYYNLGVAHGVPGILPVLAVAATSGINQAKAHALLDGAVNWLLRQARNTEQTPTFATFITPGQTSISRARLAWCYGDAGVAATLLCVADAVGRDDWRSFALNLARRSVTRTAPDDTRVRDPGLCHGAAGLAHLFNRIYQASQDNTLADAARYWLRQSLAMRRDDMPIGGYWRMHWQPGDKRAPPHGQPTTAAGFLEGAAGVALMLHAATTDIRPDWDRLLGVSLPRSP